MDGWKSGCRTRWMTGGCVRMVATTAIAGKGRGGGEDKGEDEDSSEGAVWSVGYVRHIRRGDVLPWADDVSDDENEKIK